MKPPISQEAINLYDAFTHGSIDRRAFMDRLARLAGGAAAATAMLSFLANDYARAQIVAENDPRLSISTEKFDVGDMSDFKETYAGPHIPTIRAYHAAPKGQSTLPAVIVIHENRGLNPHIKDVTRRMALEGFHAYGVDMLSPFGGTPMDEDRAREMFNNLEREKTAARLAKVVDQLAAKKMHKGQVGAVGFCWGGGMANALAAASPILKASVSYYGMQASAEEAAKIKAALMLHYAGMDERINAGAAAYEAALTQAGVEVQSFFYEGAQHAFNNDANAARYNKEAADLAWGRTIAFFKEKLAA